MAIPSLCKAAKRNKNSTMVDVQGYIQLLMPVGYLCYDLFSLLKQLLGQVVIFYLLSKISLTARGLYTITIKSFSLPDILIPYLTEMPFQWKPSMFQAYPLICFFIAHFLHCVQVGCSSVFRVPFPFEGGVNLISFWVLVISVFRVLCLGKKNSSKPGKVQ